MNTRLQVEHPVTEETTGVDLVRLQIEIAEGRKLPFNQDDLRLRGAAIEARIYAESPSTGFLPSTGTIRMAKIAQQISGIRIETGIEAGTEVPIQYDPLLAKVIARGDDRESAIRRLEHALGSFHITGVETNRDFLLKPYQDTNRSSQETSILSSSQRTLTIFSNRLSITRASWQQSWLLSIFSSHGASRTLA